MSDSEGNSTSRPLRLTCAWGDDPVLVQVRGTEAISHPYRFELSFVAESDTLDFAELLGTSATVQVDLPSGESRKWNGIVTSLHQAGRDEEFCHYTATLEPQYALFRLQSNFRIFQDATVESILREVFGDLEVDINLTKSHSTRNYCVQYGETDLAFASRVMEEEGIFYYFTHTDDSHKLCLRDDSTQLSDFDALDDVPYTKLDGGVTDEACVRTWEKTQNLVSTSVALRDTHFQDTGEPFETEQAIGSDTKVSIGTASHAINPTDTTWQVYQYPGRYVSWADDVGADLSTRQQVTNIADAAKQAAQLRATSLQNSALEIHGTSDLLLLTVGGNFTLAGHFNADGTYLVTRVEHQIDLGIGKQSAPNDSPLHYANQFACMPSDSSYVPARTVAKPVINGVQPAFVVAETDEQQLYDKYGRVKVWFPWDRREGPTVEDLDGDDGEQASDDSAEGDEKATIKASQRSCWIRVGQIWAGPRWGAFFWPRSGHEVLVAFEHGDPDRPVIVGNVYNSRNMPPLDMPDQAHVSGIRSCSVNGNPAANFNGISFHDELQNEHLELHSESHAVQCCEESNHSFVRGTSVRVFGTMYSALTSGGGGGPAADSSTEESTEDDSSDDDQSAGQLVNSLGQKWDKSKGWSKKWLAAGFESDIQVTLGHAASVIGGFPLGTASEVVQGGKLGVILDPSGWISDDTAQQIQDLIVPMGETSGVFGSKRALHYGPATTIRHGSEIVRRSSDAFDTSNPRTAWVAGIATVSTALTLLGWRLQKDDPTVWENLVRALGPRGATGVLFNLLVEYEKACGECDAGEETQNEASSLTTQTDSLDSNYQSLLLDLASTFTDRGSALSSTGASDQAQATSDASNVGDTSSFASSAEDEGEDEDENSGDDSSDDENADSGGPSDDDSGTVSTDDVAFGPDDANVYQSYDGLAATSARHLSFRARSTDEDDTDASLIHLDAQGGEDQDNGVVAINSTGQATIVCGPASFQMRRSSTTGQVSVRTGDEGYIKLASGPSDSGSNATFDPDSITLNIGGDSGSTVSMSSDSLKLSFGDSTSIELSSSGITLTCSSSKFVLSSSDLSASAENITHEASTTLTQNGTNVDIEASGQATLKGAMTMIN